MNAVVNNVVGVEAVARQAVEFSAALPAPGMRIAIYNGFISKRARNGGEPTFSACSQAFEEML